MAKAPKEKTKVIVKTSTRMSKKGPLTPDMLRKLDAYWRAANYLAAGQLYLLDNPLLREPLRPEHLKRTLVGHWGTVPGQNFIYTHLNRVITRHELNMIYVSGPGHGGNAVVAQTYLEGTYSEFYPNVSQDEEGMRRLFRQFSFPGGIGSHCAPETPGSINEGGELGYSLAHAFGAVMDNPTLIAACVVGDGEAETGPLAHARVPLSQGLDLSEGGGRRAHRGHLPRSPASGGGGRRPSGAPGGIGALAAQLPAGGAL